MPGSEWTALAAGLKQRVRALDAFFADVHGPQEALRAGVIPADAVRTSPWYERDLLGLPAPPVGIGIAGPDVVRDASGRLVVLEDNVRTPTMLAYAVVGRGMVERQLDARPPGPELSAVVRRSLRRMTEVAAPWTSEPVAAILGDGAENWLHWEVDALNRLLALPVVELEDLRVRGQRLVLADSGQAVDVLWRRTSEERLREDSGRLNRLGEALLTPLRAGRLAVVNAFGTGVGDDKRMLAHVEDLVRFFLGEEPTLPSAVTYDLADPPALATALERLGELVIKPRDGSGGRGVLIGPAATRDQLEGMRRTLRREPGRWIAQETVALSTHPTLVDGRLEARHVDLRPYVISHGHEYEVLPIAFSRFAASAGDLVVNCSQGGGGKDVWIVPE
jgi:carboxylate-amine ligase